MASVTEQSSVATDERSICPFRHLEDLIQRAEGLHQRCETNMHIPGMTRLLKNCQSEQQFLIRLRKKKQLEMSHLNCTNLSHLEAILSAVDTLPHVVQILQPFTCPHSNQSVTVDVICNHGYTWVKVIARKPYSLHRIWIGEGQFGEKPITDQAALYLSCAGRYQISFTNPQVLFWFMRGVSSPLSACLQAQGVSVTGRLYKVVRAETTQQRNTTTTQHGAATNTQGNTAAESDDDDHIPTASELLNSRREAASTTNTSLPQVENGRVPTKDLSDDHIPTASELLSSLAMAESDDDDEDEEEIVDISRFSLVPADTSHPDCSDSDPDVSGAISRDLCAQSQSALFCSVPVITRVNIDITSLICLVSNVCHGRCHLMFEEGILTQQAAWERERPVLPKLRSFLKGKELLACQTAVTDFRSILDTVGGEHEKTRAEEFLRDVTVVPDQVSDWAQTLTLTHHVKQRAKIIFGTGHELRAVTVTANSGFVRAAIKQGMNFAVFLHESRALTEQKECTAKPL